MNEPNESENSFSDKVKKLIDSLKMQVNTDKVTQFASNNVRDTLAYILTLTGLFLLFFEPYFAGALIGIIFGLYFSPEILSLYHNYSQLVQHIGLTRSLLLISLLLACFISAPFLFFGILVAVAFRQIL